MNAYVGGNTQAGGCLLPAMAGVSMVGRTISSKMSMNKMKCVSCVGVDGVESFVESFIFILSFLSAMFLLNQYLHGVLGRDSLNDDTVDGGWFIRVVIIYPGDRLTA